MLWFALNEQKLFGRVNLYPLIDIAHKIALYYTIQSHNYFSENVFFSLAYILKMYVN